jgi:hypothetical protein
VSLDSFKSSVSLDQTSRSSMPHGGRWCLTSAHDFYHISNLSAQIVLVKSLRAIMSYHAHEPFTIAFVLRTHKGAGTGVDKSLLQTHRPRNDEHLVANLSTQRLNLSLDS